MKPILSDLKQLLIVSEVIISVDDLKKYDYCNVEVQKFEGVRCERCWNYFNERYIIDDICPRCYEVVNED